MLFESDKITPFTTGSIPFRMETVEGAGGSKRILIQIEVDGLPMEAVVDTGGAWAIVHPDYISLLNLDPEASIGIRTLGIRGVEFQGHLYRLPMSLQAAEGESLTREVTVFVADDPEAWRDLPNFLGLDGCLEHLRIAVDPAKDTFHFGATA